MDLVCTHNINSTQAPSSKTKTCRKTKIGANVPQRSSNQCANFQLKRS